MVLDAALLNTQYYKVRIKGKVKQSKEGVVPFPTPRRSSYKIGGARGVMVIVVENGHGDTSSNPGWDWLQFI